MRRGNLIRLLMLAMLCAQTGLAGAQLPASQGSAASAGPENQRAVKHNPFLKPDISQSMEQPDVEEKTPEPQKILHLRAILYSSATPLVNINGKILAVGEQIEGFQLQEVSEQSAILSNDDVQIMLSMNENE